MMSKDPANLSFYESKNKKNDSKQKRKKCYSCSLDKWVSGNTLLEEDSSHVTATLGKVNSCPVMDCVGEAGLKNSKDTSPSNYNYNILNPKEQDIQGEKIPQ